MNKQLGRVYFNGSWSEHNVWIKDCEVNTELSRLNAKIAELGDGLNALQAVHEKHLSLHAAVVSENAGLIADNGMLQKLVERLERICSAAYQMAGVVNANCWRLDE